MIHIVDSAEENFDEKIMSVEDTLIRTKLIDHKRIIIFNKIDLINDENLVYLREKFQQPCVSSLKNMGIQDARREIERIVKSSLKNQKVVNL